MSGAIDRVYPTHTAHQQPTPHDQQIKRNEQYGNTTRYIFVEPTTPNTPATKAYSHMQPRVTAHPPYGHTWSTAGSGTDATPTFGQHTIVTSYPTLQQRTLDVRSHPPILPSLPSPAYPHDPKFHSSTCLPSALHHTPILVRCRTWWSLKSSVAKALYMAIGVTLLLLAVFTVTTITSRIDAIDLDAQHAALLAYPTPTTPSTSPYMSPPLLDRFRTLASRLASFLSFSSDDSRFLGDWSIVSDRIGVESDSSSPLSRHRGHDYVGDITSHLLDRATFEAHIIRQNKITRTEQQQWASQNVVTDAPHNANAAQPADNPWYTRSVNGRLFSSITLFSIIPDLDFEREADMPPPSESTVDGPSMLTLTLLSLASWTRLVPSHKIHLFVPNSATCEVLVGHDGSDSGRRAAIDAAAAQQPHSTRFAEVHCRPFPCRHPKYQRGLVSCVWNDVAARSSIELDHRHEAIRAEGSKEWQQQFELLVRNRTETSTIQRRRQEHHARIEERVEDETEILMYVTPRTLFDVQLLTAITKLEEDGRRDREKSRRMRSKGQSSADVGRHSVSADSDPLSLSAEDHAPPQLDTSGRKIVYDGAWFAVGRRTDITVDNQMINQVATALSSSTNEHSPNTHSPSSSSSSSNVDPTSLSIGSWFHSSTGHTPSLISAGIESLWQHAYRNVNVSYTRGGTLHGGFGIDYMVVPLKTYERLVEQQTMEDQSQRFDDEEEEEDDQDKNGDDSHSQSPPTASASIRGSLFRLYRHLASSTASLHGPSRLLAGIDSLPSSTVTGGSNHFFPPFLVGLYRWENWLLSRVILLESSFRVRVIDMTPAVTVVKMDRHTTPTNTAERSDVAARLAVDGARYNEALVQMLTEQDYRIGSIEFAPWQLLGSCAIERVRRKEVEKGSNSYAMPSTSSVRNDVSPPRPLAWYDLPIHSNLFPPLCHVQSRAPSNFSNLYWFTRHASKAPLPERYIVVLTVNYGYLKLALNWLCWSRRIEFHNFLLLAEDQRSARLFRQLGAPVIVSQAAPEHLPPSDYGSVAFQRTMSFRTEFLMEVLEAGFHFVTADMDAIWTDNPIPSFPIEADLSGQPHKVYKLSGGFIVVRSTPYGRYLWSRVIACQRSNTAFLATHKVGTYEPSQFTEQYCINELSLAIEKKQTSKSSSTMLSDTSSPAFLRRLLDPYEFPDGKSFFDQRLSQHRGIQPIVIHNNWIMGTEGKFQRMKRWKMVAIATTSDGNTHGGLEKSIALGEWIAAYEDRNTNTARMTPFDEKLLGVCADEMTIREEPIPAIAAVTNDNNGSEATQPTESHAFHLYIRLFLSSNATDGVAQPGELDHLKQCVRSIIDADYTSSSSPQVHPAIQLDLMVDHPPSTPTSDETSELEQIETIVTEMQREWNNKLHGSRQMDQITRRPSLEINIRRPDSTNSNQVGQLGLWLLPWPSVLSAATESRPVGDGDDTPTADAVGGSRVTNRLRRLKPTRASSEPYQSSQPSSRRPDASLYLHESVALSREWWQFTLSALKQYQPPASNTDEPPHEADPRVYGISLLDVHHIYGESILHSYSSDPSHVSGRFQEFAYFRRPNRAAWNRLQTNGSTLPTTFFETKLFGYQSLPDASAFILLPNHFDDFREWTRQRTLPSDTSKAHTANCIPTLWSNKRILSSPAHVTWAESINRWAYEKGLYALHARVKRVRVTTTKLERRTNVEDDVDDALRMSYSDERFAFAVTQQQATEKGNVTLIQKLSPFDSLPSSSPSSSSLPIFDFHFRLVRRPATLAYRSILAPTDQVDPCYTIDRLEEIEEENKRVEVKQAEEERKKKMKEKEEKKRVEEEKKKRRAAEEKEKRKMTNNKKKGE